MSKPNNLCRLAFTDKDLSISSLVLYELSQAKWSCSSPIEKEPMRSYTINEERSKLLLVSSAICDIWCQKWDLFVAGVSGDPQ